jgi:hypothetical protein
MWTEMDVAVTFSNGPQVPVRSYARIEQGDAVARQKSVESRHAKNLKDPVKRVCLHLPGKRDKTNAE